MKRPDTRTIIVVLFLASALTISFNTPQVSPQPTVIIVPDNYLTIQGAVNAANPGDTIYVRSGTYVESIYIDKSVTLMGENRNITIIDVGPIADLVDYAIYVVADNVTIMEFTIECYDHEPPLWPDGIFILDCRGGTILNNKIRGFMSGITIWTGNNHDIRGNHIEDNLFAGIYLEDSSNNTIIGNQLYMNAVGIETRSSSGNTIFHNNFDSNGPPSAIVTLGDTNTWDNGYPSGGNYWSDYSDVDLYSGPYQNETGSDGIWDHPYIIDAKNQDRYPLVNPWTPFHDVAVVNITPMKLKAYTTWGQAGGNNKIPITVTVKNNGTASETFSVSARYTNASGTTVIGTKPVVNLGPGLSTTLTFSWAVGVGSGMAVGSYTISANASVVAGETNTANNDLTDGIVKIHFGGDANGDGFIGGYDATMISINWWSNVPPAAQEADFNEDGFVGGYDATLISINWWTSVPKP